MRSFFVAAALLFTGLLMVACEPPAAAAPAASAPAPVPAVSNAGPAAPPSLRALAAAPGIASGPPRDMLADPLRGIVAPSDQVVLNAPLDGVIKTINVKEGDAVKKGDVLAVMDDSVQQVVLRNTELQATATGPIGRAKAALSIAEMRLANTRKLLDQSATYQWEVDQRTADRDAAAADLQDQNERHAQAEAAVVLERSRLDQFKLRASFDGIVIRIPTKAGAMLSRSDQVLSMAELDPLEAPINLPVEVMVDGKSQILYGQLKQGQTYKLRAATPINRELDGTIRVIDPVIDHASGTFRVVFRIENKDLKMPAGFSATLIWPQP